MQLKTVKIEELKPHPKNPNKHPEEQIKELSNSLDEFDQVKNIVVWQDFVIAGCGLLEAAIKQGHEEIEIKDVSDWPEEKAIKFMISDNRLAAMAIMDNDLLSELLIDFDEPLDIPGIDQKLLDELGAATNIDILDSTGGLSGSQYGLAGSATKVPVSVLGIGGLVDREVMEQFKARLIENGAKEESDNGELIKEIILKGLI